ncbi:hypothetical protein DFH09DRAFT_1081890 [Mycena vulgaris]|nr:hypothetical protein DFH09DRAFT_1081890 [Mycena vulgaris]
MPRAWDAFAQRTAWKIRAPRAAAARSAVFRRSAGYDFGAPAYYCPLTRDVLVSRAALSSRGESRMGLPRAAPKLTRAPRVRLYSRCLCAVPINSTGDDDSSSNPDRLRPGLPRWAGAIGGLRSVHVHERTLWDIRVSVVREY